MKRFFITFLMLCFLAACDEGGSGNNGNGLYIPGFDSEIATQTEYDHPIFDNIEALGFYDYDRYDNIREVRNDLTGTLNGMVQFVQTHSVNPKGNEKNNMPLIITEREALLLFTPPDWLSRSISVEIYVDGVFMEKKELDHPNLMPKSDNIDNRGRPDLIYSRRSWSTVLDWSYVKTGLELKFADNTGRYGTLYADDIEFGAPVEGMFAFLRVGMLTDFPVGGSGVMMTEPARAMTEYFQTVPYARLINVTYENISLPKVIISSGVIYDNASSDPKLKVSQTEGSRYAGDMRADVAKSQISIGINFANYGIPSTDMSQKNPQLFFSMVAHLAEGVYLNGKQRHGLSGGGGILTLVDTKGNEFSHEVGHGYGLGHFPGAQGNDYFWSAHHSESGWGYDAFKKRMRANVHWTWDGSGASVNGVKSPDTFKRIYSYNRDAMAGGEAVSRISRYTYHTGYSALRIQNNLTSKAVPSSTSSTGYVKWDNEAKKMKEFSFPEKDKRLKPFKIGVPVFTVIGGYNPDNYAQSLLYKPLRGNYGNIFKYPAPDKSSEEKACWLRVTYKDNTVEEINLIAIKPKGSLLQVGVNIEEARKPITAALYCGSNSTEKRLGNEITFPQDLKPMPKPVIIGKERGFKDAKKYEIDYLNEALKDHIGKEFFTLTPGDEQSIRAVGDNVTEYDAEVRDVVARFFELDKSYKTVSRFINKYKNELLAPNDARADEFHKLLMKNGFMNDDGSIDITAAPLKIMNDKYMAVEAGEVVVKNVTDVTGNESWLMDMNGRIHLGADLGKCLTSAGSGKRLIISPCSQSANSTQLWLEKDSIISLNLNSDKKFAIDYATTKGYPILYPYHGNANQKWVGMKRSKDPFLAVMDNEYINFIAELFSK